MQAGFESENRPRAGTGGDGCQPASRPRFKPPAPEELAGRFPQLEILELLGKGGMGAVYKARQRGLDRLVAVKILPPEVGRDPAFAERFTREARALAQLSHPNIVGVYDFGQTEGLYYFVMEYVDGVNLRQAILSGGMTPKEALAIVPQICEALQFAHDEGIVHRDIKPENILIDKKGRVKIADFGLAKLLGHEPADQRLTATRQVMGTLRYMAPEQLEGSHDVDHRADIYSLGVVFYELLTGELPIGRFAPPSKKVQIDVRLDEVVLRALEKEPEQRYQHASELKTGVDQISGSAPPAVRSPMPAVNASGKARRVQLGLPFIAKAALVTTLAWLLTGMLWNAREVGILIGALAVGVANVFIAQRVERLVAVAAGRLGPRQATHSSDTRRLRHAPFDGGRLLPVSRRSTRPGIGRRGTRPPFRQKNSARSIRARNIDCCNDSTASEPTFLALNWCRTCGQPRRAASTLRPMRHRRSAISCARSLASFSSSGRTCFGVRMFGCSATGLAAAGSRWPSPSAV